MDEIFPPEGEHWKTLSEDWNGSLFLPGRGQGVSIGRFFFITIGSLLGIV